MNLTNIDRELQSEFALKKLQAEKIANESLSKARSNSNFVNLEILEREATFELGKAKFNNEDKSKISEYENTLSQIHEYKQKLLKEMGLTFDDLTPKYACEKCGDSGIYLGNTCDCYKKRRTEEIIKNLNLDEKQVCSFDEINESLFEKNDFENFMKLKNLLEKWCNNYPNITKRTIVLSGQTGVGKTYLAKCMTKNLIQKDIVVCFVTAFEMNNMMLKYHTTFDSEKYSHILPLVESDVLIIDDLGSEPLINNVTINYLFNILSEREESKKSTIITTNLSTADIVERYKDRIRSRLFNKQTGKIIYLQGSDLRLKKYQISI